MPYKMAMDYKAGCISIPSNILLMMISFMLLKLFKREKQPKGFILKLRRGKLRLEISFFYFFFYNIKV